MAFDTFYLKLKMQLKLKEGVHNTMKNTKNGSYGWESLSVGM